MKDKKIFKKFLIIYFSIIGILCGLFIYYVIDSLVLYENSEVDKYVANLVIDISHNAKRNKIDKYIDVANMNVSNFEDTNNTVSEAYANVFKTKEITYKLVESPIKEKPEYIVYADGDELFTIRLKSNGDIHRMGLLTFPDWQIDKIIFSENRGVYYYDIYALDTYKVLVNGKEVNKELGVKSELDKELSELSKFAELPATVMYKISNLTSEPEIQVFDGNKEIDLVKNNRTIEAYELFTTNDVEELNSKLADDIDIIAMGEMWSKFLTDDLSGTYHGYSTIKNYLIEGTELWDMAYAWSHGVDITFVSNHTLVGFDNERVSNCVVYNKNAFSCDVYLEKNMRLRSGKAKQDIMNDKFYFVYTDNVWKLVSMKAITENND